jgi:hypothetical protein
VISRFMNISISKYILHRLKRDEKRNKYGSIPNKNEIPRKRTEKPLSRFRKHENGIPQIRKRVEQNRKRDESERDFFRPFFCHYHHAPLTTATLIPTLEEFSPSEIFLYHYTLPRDLRVFPFINPDSKE